METLLATARSSVSFVADYVPSVHATTKQEIAVIYFVAFILTIVTPLAGGFGAIYSIDTYLEVERQRRTVKWLSITAELMFLAAPSLILVLFGFLSVTTAMWIVIGGYVLFAIAIWVHNGNDFESFVMTAIMMIIIPHTAISVSKAYETYERRNQIELNEPANKSATNNPMNPSGG